MEQVRFDLSGVAVHIGMPVHGNVPPETMMAMVETACALKERGIPFEVKAQYGCSIIDLARNYVADNFLASNATHLFMIDSDMEWSGNHILRLLALGTRYPVVAGIYPVKRDPETWAINNSGTVEVDEFDLLPIDGVGLGFCCVQRWVMETLAARAEKVNCLERIVPIARIFQCGVKDGWFQGEDMRFFEDVKGLGVQPLVDPTIRLGHVGSKVFKGDFMAAIADRRVASAKE